MSRLPPQKGVIGEKNGDKETNTGKRACKNTAFTVAKKCREKQTHPLWGNGARGAEKDGKSLRFLTCL